MKGNYRTQRKSSLFCVESSEQPKNDDVDNTLYAGFCEITDSFPIDFSMNLEHILFNENFKVNS